MVFLSPRCFRVVRSSSACLNEHQSERRADHASLHRSFLSGLSRKRPGFPVEQSGYVLHALWSLHHVVYESGSETFVTGQFYQDRTQDFYLCNQTHCRLRPGSISTRMAAISFMGLTGPCP